MPFPVPPEIRVSVRPNWTVYKRSRAFRNAVASPAQPERATIDDLNLFPSSAITTADKDHFRHHAPCQRHNGTLLNMFLDIALAVMMPMAKVLRAAGADAVQHARVNFSEPVDPPRHQPGETIFYSRPLLCKTLRSSHLPSLSFSPAIQAPSFNAHLQISRRSPPKRHQHDFDTA